MFNWRVLSREITFLTFFWRRLFVCLLRFLSVLILFTSKRFRLTLSPMSKTFRRPMLLLLIRCWNDVEKRFERVLRLLRRPVKRLSRQDDDDHRDLSADFQNFQIGGFRVPELVYLTIQDPSGLKEVFEPIVNTKNFKWKSWNEM